MTRSAAETEINQCMTVATAVLDNSPLKPTLNKIVPSSAHQSYWGKSEHVVITMNNIAGSSFWLSLGEAKYFDDKYLKKNAIAFLAAVSAIRYKLFSDFRNLEIKVMKVDNADVFGSEVNIRCEDKGVNCIIGANSFRSVTGIYLIIALCMTSDVQNFILKRNLLPYGKDKSGFSISDIRKIPTEVYRRLATQTYLSTSKEMNMFSSESLEILGQFLNCTR